MAKGSIAELSLFCHRWSATSHRFDFYLKRAAFRAGFGGRTHLEYATDHQLFSCACEPERDRSCDIQRWNRRRIGCHGCLGDALGVRSPSQAWSCQFGEVHMKTKIDNEYSEIAAQLKKGVEGDVHFDRYSRLLYSTDASMYQIEPIGVVVPRHKGDVQAVIETANKFNAPVLPRGGGTSLAGQTVGHAIVLDFSKYMKNVLDVNREELWCRVQPGLVQDELNAYVRPMGLQFGPDTSTSNRATIGGMIGNNSAGAHSLTYGKTLDHVLELTVLLSDGSELVLKDLSPEALADKCEGNSLENRVYREIMRLAQRHKDEILARYPKIMRRVSGYNLDEFIKPQTFNLSRILVGSEGTLGTVVEAKMRLVPKPKWSGMDVIHFYR